jgi:DNA-binding transcriptional LysR family regulator
LEHRCIGGNGSGEQRDVPPDPELGRGRFGSRRGHVLTVRAASREGKHRGRSHGARYGLEPLFAALAERHPALHLRFRQDSNASLLADVGDGQLDLAVTFCARIPADLEHDRLKDEQMVAAVAATHPLADLRTVALYELRGETFALDGSGENRDYDAAIVEACRRSGFEPRTRPTAEMRDAWPEVIAAEGCVGLTARSSIHAVNRDLRLLDLDEPLTFPIELVWRAPPRPTVQAVVETARGLHDARGWSATA